MYVCLLRSRCVHKDDISESCYRRRSALHAGSQAQRGRITNSVTDDAPHYMPVYRHKRGRISGSRLVANSSSRSATARLTTQHARVFEHSRREKRLHLYVPLSQVVALLCLTLVRSSVTYSTGDRLFCCGDGIGDNAYLCATESSIFEWFAGSSAWFCRRPPPRKRYHFVYYDLFRSDVPAFFLLFSFALRLRAKVCPCVHFGLGNACVALTCRLWISPSSLYSA